MQQSHNFKLAQLVVAYKEAEKRATPCYTRAYGISFQTNDRADILAKMKEVSISRAELATALSEFEVPAGAINRHTAYSKHFNRLSQWQLQERRGMFRMRGLSEVQHSRVIGQEAIHSIQPVQFQTEGQIEEHLKGVCLGLVKRGITSTKHVSQMLERAMNFAHNEVKVEVKAKRIAREIKEAGLEGMEVDRVLKLAKEFSLS